MITEQIFYTQPYITELDATVLSIDSKGANGQVQLSATIFYPVGGGQPCDVGEILGGNGKLKVDSVSLRDNQIIHQGKLIGSFAVGENVRLQIKWSARHHAMRSHSAGHAVHEAIIALGETQIPVSANHGSKCYVQYEGTFTRDIREEVERRVNDLVVSNPPLFMRQSTFDEIRAKCKFIPAGLPTNKPLRTVQIGESGQIIPCGGVHVCRLGEVGRVIVGAIEYHQKTLSTFVNYRITRADDTIRSMETSVATTMSSPQSSISGRES